MEIVYSRNLTASRMILEAAEPLAKWEERMIASVAAEGLLFGEQMARDGQNQIWYDITGKQSLQQFLEGEELGYDLLAALLVGIYEAVERVEALLLDADAILLLPETVFLDYRTGKACFCYYPGNGKTLPEMFADLMEYLLVHLDHGDDAAVKLAYDAYGQIPKGSIKMLADILRTPYEPEYAEDAGVENGPGEPVKPEQTAWQEHGKKTERPVKRIVPENAFGKCGVLGEKLSALGEIIRSILNRAEGGRRRQSAEEPYIFDPEDEEELPEKRPTVLLRELNRPPEGILRYEGIGDCTDLEIRGESCLIGSDSACEGYIPSATVSRRHAKVTRKGDLFFIEDLNSANGTYVGGTLLNYRTKMSLEKNEIVLFADEKFRFI